MFFGASAFSVCSAVTFKGIYGNFTGKLDSAMESNYSSYLLFSGFGDLNSVLRSCVKGTV